MEIQAIHGSGITACSAQAPAGGSLGSHLAKRLVQIGVKDVFSVPGDFNLALLDHLIAEPELNLIGCCNELNAGYAAGGYARAKGVGACVVTFTVGGLSVLNAIAGAYSENLPVICIVGGPNSNDYGTNRILHHTIGLPDFSQELRCFQTVTCIQDNLFSFGRQLHSPGSIPCGRQHLILLGVRPAYKGVIFCSVHKACWESISKSLFNVILVLTS
ncbi:pyruvate decarboxylase 1-like [Coffea eugenioides]|uniref:pyruvate decarboxylase 1-like n=1 Tax=Coffea eugenioides TaxID=49369 RepID=UPI000F611F42|nr:pyruvate decarboxylase 1-like [Coffea eugenioides]